MTKKVTMQSLVNDIDEGISDAVEALKVVLRDEKSKGSEKISAAKAIIGLKITIQEMLRQQAMQRIDLRLKSIKLEAEEIKLENLKTAIDPSAPVHVQEQYSRVFSPDLRAKGLNPEVALKREG